MDTAEKSKGRLAQGPTRRPSGRCDHLPGSESGAAASEEAGDLIPQALHPAQKPLRSPHRALDGPPVAGADARSFPVSRRIQAGPAGPPWHLLLPRHIWTVLSQMMAP